MSVLTAPCVGIFELMRKHRRKNFKWRDFVMGRDSGWFLGGMAATALVVALTYGSIFQADSGLVQIKNQESENIQEAQPMPPDHPPRFIERSQDQNTAVSLKWESQKWERGITVEGQAYETSLEFWKQVYSEGIEQWNQLAVRHWEQQDPTNDTTMLGQGQSHEADIRDSRKLLSRTLGWWTGMWVQRKEQGWTALDCGAGAGRLTKALLLHMFSKVDLMEPSLKLMAKAEADLGGERHWPGTPPGHHVEQLMQGGVQEVGLDPFRYHVIWVQGVLEHLSDEDAVKFFARARMGLEAGGLFFVKERVARRGFVADNTTASFVRSRRLFERLFAQVALMVVDHGKQADMPPSSPHGVHMWTLARAPPTSNLRQKEFEAAQAAGRIQKAGPEDVVPLPF